MKLIHTYPKIKGSAEKDDVEDDDDDNDNDNDDHMNDLSDDDNHKKR